MHYCALQHITDPRKFHAENFFRAASLIVHAPQIWFMFRWPVTALMPVRIQLLPNQLLLSVLPINEPALRNELSLASANRIIDARFTQYKCWLQV